jgi:hypothetical protein
MIRLFFYLLLILAAVASFLFAEDAVANARWLTAMIAAAAELVILTLALATLARRQSDFDYRLWLFG